MRAERGRGSISVMVVGFFLVVALMTVVVVDASAAYLQRQALAGLADGAALAAADGVQGAQVYEGGLDDRARIDAVSAEFFVGDYLEATGATRMYDGLRWRVSGEGQAVRVSLSAPMRLPLVPPGWAGTTTVVAEAAVELRLS